MIGASLVALALAVPPPAPDLYSETISPPFPRGTVIVTHGGGWLHTGADDTHWEEPNAARFRSYGWRTVNIDYRPGRDSLRDVVRWHDHVRARYAGPLVAYGQSAGASLALMLANRRPGLCAVVGYGAITDLTRVHGTREARILRTRYIRVALGRNRALLRRWSPHYRPPQRDQRLLLASSAADAWAPPHTQILRFAARHRRRALTLRSGKAPFIHAPVAEAARQRVYRAEQRLLAAVAEDRSCAP